MTLCRALEWLVRDAESLHASAIELQFAREGFGLIVGSVGQVCVATRARLAAVPESRPGIDVMSHIRERASDEGWRYFDGYRPIPPDSDDLALVLHVVAAAGVSAEAPWIAKPLAHLARNRLAPGLFPTWLIPDANNRSAADLAWASGSEPVHPEVVANINHALLKLSPTAWQDDILAAAHWLAADPTARLNGNHWYYGHGYAAWLICDFLRSVHATGLLDTRRSLLTYRDVLACEQNERGAWALNRPPLARVGLSRPPMTLLQHSVSETAWRMAALRCTGLAIADPILQRSAQFLAGAQHDDGGFAAEPFFETLSVEPYSSRTVTTAAVLHALAP
jgi:hypothetical protein